MNRIDEIRKRLTDPVFRYLEPHRLREDMQDIAFLLERAAELEKREADSLAELRAQEAKHRSDSLLLSAREGVRAVDRCYAHAFTIAIRIVEKGGA
jgi:hypothetical protein